MSAQEIKREGVAPRKGRVDCNYAKPTENIKARESHPASDAQAEMMHK